jgi:hypothetical protein
MEPHRIDISLLKCHNCVIFFRNITLHLWLCYLELSVKWNPVRHLSELRAKYLWPFTVKPTSHGNIKMTKPSIWRIEWKPFLQSRMVTRICTTCFNVQNLYLLPTDCRVIHRANNNYSPEQNYPARVLWRVLRSRMEKTVSGYGGQLRIYWTCRGQPTRGGPPTGGLSLGLTTHHKKTISLRNVTKGLELGRILSTSTT